MLLLLLLLQRVELARGNGGGASDVAVTVTVTAQESRMSARGRTPSWGVGPLPLTEQARRALALAAAAAAAASPGGGDAGAATATAAMDALGKAVEAAGEADVAAAWDVLMPQHEAVDDSSTRKTILTVVRMGASGEIPRAVGVAACGRALEALLRSANLKRWLGVKSRPAKAMAVVPRSERVRLGARAVLRVVSEDVLPLAAVRDDQEWRDAACAALAALLERVDPGGAWGSDELPQNVVDAALDGASRADALPASTRLLRALVAKPWRGVGERVARGEQNVVVAALPFACEDVLRVVLASSPGALQAALVDLDQRLSQGRVTPDDAAIRMCARVAALDNQQDCEAWCGFLAAGLWHAAFPLSGLAEVLSSVEPGSWQWARALSRVGAPRMVESLVAVATMNSTPTASRAWEALTHAASSAVCRDDAAFAQALVTSVVPLLDAGGTPAPGKREQSLIRIRACVCLAAWGAGHTPPPPRLPTSSGHSSPARRRKGDEEDDDEGHSVVAPFTWPQRDEMTDAVLSALERCASRMGEDAVVEAHALRAASRVAAATAQPQAATRVWTMALEKLRLPRDGENPPPEKLRWTAWHALAVVAVVREPLLVKEALVLARTEQTPKLRACALVAVEAMKRSMGGMAELQTDVDATLNALLLLSL